MEYHYQWPEYLDTTLSERRGWESLCLSPPPLYPDTPTMRGCITGVLPRGRPMRRRRLFPPPYNRFPRESRPQWSAPCCNYRPKWNPETPPNKVYLPQCDNCYDYECLVDKTYTDRPSPTPLKKIRRGKGSLQQSKTAQFGRNSDHLLLGSNRKEWTESVLQNECTSPYRTTSAGYPSFSFTDNISVCKSPEDDEIFQSAVIPVSNCETRKATLPQNGFATSGRTSVEGSEISLPESGKDKLTSIINSTIFECPNGNNIYQDTTGSYRRDLKHRFGEESTETCQETVATDSEFASSTPNVSQNSYSDQLLYNNSSENFLNEFSNETGVAVFNLLKTDHRLNSDTTETIRYEDQVFSSEQQHIFRDAKTINSLVAYDPPKFPQSNNESNTVKSGINLNNTNLPNSDLTNNNNSQLCSSETNDTISSLVQQNQLLTDLLSHLISGNIEVHKEAFANTQLLTQPQNPSSKEIVNALEVPIHEFSSLENVQELDTSSLFENVLPSDLDIFSELQLLPLPAQETSVSISSTEQFVTDMNRANFVKGYEKIPKDSKRVSLVEADNLDTNRSLLLQVSDSPYPIETLPSNIDFPSSDSETNLIETTLSSVTNYILEEPLNNISDSLSSILKVESSSELIPSSAKPNSFQKVKKTRKRYKKCVEKNNIKKNEKKVAKSSKCKKLTNKCFKMIQKCRHKCCKEEECDSTEEYEDLDKKLRNSEVQVDESDIENEMMGKDSYTRDVGTQCELIKNNCNTTQGAISIKQDFSKQYNLKNPVYETEEPNNREEDNFIKNETVSVMLLEFPVSVKQISMHTTSSEIETYGGSSMQVNTGVLGLASKVGRTNESSAKICDSKNRTFAVSFEDSSEINLPVERKCHQNVELLSSGTIATISNLHQPNDFIGKICHLPVQLGKTQTPSNINTTQNVCNSSDRVLRKRKAVCYSEPIPCKRTRLNSVDSEMEFVENKSPQKNKKRNVNKNVGGSTRRGNLRKSKFFRNLNSKGKETKKGIQEKLSRRKTD